MEQAMENETTDHLDVLMTREQAAEALTKIGFPVKPKTLAVWASRGDGPPYQMFRARALYKWSEVEAWARSRLAAPRRCASA
jgi:hypothetical protein